MKHDFCDGFRFLRLKFENYSYTDNRAGCVTNYIAEMLSGRARLVSDTYTVEIAAGDFFFIPQGCQYQSYWYGDPKIDFFSFGADYIPEPNEVTIPIQKIELDDAGKRRKCLKLEEQIKLGGRADSSDISAFYQLFDLLLPFMRTERVDGVAKLVGKAEKIMRRDPTLSIPEVASQCGVSESTLYASFASGSSETPALMRQRLLAEKAEMLLITTNMPIERICDRLGYSSASYFRKMIHKYLGASPRDVRKRRGI